MSEQPNALRLAERLDSMSDSMDMGRPPINDDRRLAAAELRRLHSLNAELLEFAKGFLADYQSEDGMYSMKHYARMAHEVITKAEAQQ